MVRIMHTADLHLGMKFSAYPEVREELSAARFATLETIVAIANSERCSILVVAGDLFDRPAVAAAEVQRAAQAFARFEGDVALVLPGNHDFAAPDSELWTRFRKASGDRTLVLDRTEAVDLRHFGPNAAVYPAPCTARRSPVNNVGWIDAAVRIPEVEHHIGIAHGSLLGLSPDPNMQYYPMAPENLQKLPVDLWLLGHTHIRYPATPRKGDRIFNPGTPEPDGFDCLHGGAAFVLDLEPGSPPTVKTVATGRYRFADREITVTPETKLEAIPGMVRDDIGPRMLLRLALKGSVSAESRAAFSPVESDLRSRAFYLNIDYHELREAITPERIEREFADGSFARRLLENVLETGDEIALEIAFDLIEEARVDH